MSPRHTVLLMVVIPIVLWISYFHLLLQPRELSNWTLQNPCRRPECQPIIERHDDEVRESRLTFSKRVLIIRGLLKYMIPLGLIYFAEYFINQGLFELLFFRKSVLDHDGQYRWYQTLYQCGVFISRSSGNCFRLQRIWILAILQIANMIFLLFEVWYAFIPSIWIMFVIILYEGLLGGGGYVNTFRNIRLESPEEEREFAMGAASVADTLGIALSGAVALPFHDRMCRLD
ncbi:battenin [Scyliorhinus torazame]|uniref:battenin n=1 Tax=Scyliorhinus torazame TaxID=75743 RepID=UPI003B5C4ADA